MSESMQALEESIGAMALGEQPEEATEEEVQQEAQEEVEELEEEQAGGEESEEEAEQESEETQESEELVEVEFNGQLFEAPKAIAEALMKNADYTQKTQEVAARRKEVEVITETLGATRKQFEFAQSVQPDLLKAQMLEQEANNFQQHLKDNIDALSSTDIEKIRMAMQDRREQRDEIVRSLQQKEAEFQQAQEQSREELLKKGTEVLRSKIPGWGEESQKQLREYALLSGFTEQEVAGLIDPRQVETLWKARQYDELQKGKAAAVKTVQSAPVIKAKPRKKMSKETGHRLNLRKKLNNPRMSAKDKASAMERHFGDILG